MAEESDRPAGLRDRLERLMDEAVSLAEVANDQKTNSLIESRMRMIAAALRAHAILRGPAGREDNMSTNEQADDEARLARADELRADIERRLTRIRAELESKSMAEEPDAGAD